MKKDLAVAFFLTALLLSVHLLVMDGYGLTWDFHHHFLAGMHMLKQEIAPDLTDHLPFTEPDPRLSVDLPYGPLATVAPVFTYLLFFRKLGLLAFDNAYHLAIILWGVAGIFAFFLFLREAIGSRVAFIGFFILALYPRYFGDLHNNMKDVPQAASFALSVYLFFRLVNYRRFRDVILAAFGFAIAFNSKINTVFAPVIVVFWFIFLIVSGAGKNLKNPLSKIRTFLPQIFLAALLSAIFAVIIWWPFFRDPLERIRFLPTYYGYIVTNIEVLYYGKWYCSGHNVPWHYPFGYLAAVTPLPVTFFFMIGFITSLTGIFRKKPIASLLLLWFIVPLLRFFLPKVGVMDGIRHFQEVVFPLAAIAALGFDQFLSLIPKLSKKYQAIISRLLMIVGFTYLAFINILYYPYQISYFSEAVGGIKGAYGKFDLDYWGNSQKQAVIWLNKNAPANAVVHIVMSGDTAGKYLRPDLLARLNTKGYDESDYVVVLNRQSFFYRYFYLWEYFLRRQTAFIVENQGVPLVWVYDNSKPAIPRRANWWPDESPCIRKYWTSD